MQHSILGIMPPEMVPSRMSSGASEARTTGIRLDGSSLSLSRPTVSVMEIRLSAPSALAMRAAAVSALML